MAALETRQFMCLSDNFGVLIHDTKTGATAAIDVPETAPVQAMLDETGWKLSHILVTHHHRDHTQGVAKLKANTGASVIGPDKSAKQVGLYDVMVEDGETFPFGSFEVCCIATPGHTLDQISYWISEAEVAFTGDTLFALGCGRVIEGDYAMMWNSLDKLITMLPPQTTIYCGHEYTLANARFAITVDPANATLAERLADVERLRAAGKSTLPTTMGLELATNPFLRARDSAIQATLGMEGAQPGEVFAEVRRRKDSFKG